MPQDIDLDFYRFIQIPAIADVPYSFCIGKYPVTNAQYERFLNASDFADETLWRGFLKFDEDCIQIGKWANEGQAFVQRNARASKRIEPTLWTDENFGIRNPKNPVVGISWYESNAYCSWLMRHWNELAESIANTTLHPRLLRLPLETEWITAAGGETPNLRFPWDATGKATADIKEIIKYANVEESAIGHTTPVNAYLQGVSSRGVMDMAGNVWEWQGNYSSKSHTELGARGGSYDYYAGSARASFGNSFDPGSCCSFIGFRVVAFL